MVRTIFILLCFPSLDDSIATIEIRTSAQRKNTKIKGLIFIIDIYQEFNCQLGAIYIVHGTKIS
jgi:hypothetical protein